MGTARGHFEAMAATLAEEETDALREAASHDPGEKIRRSLEWSDACMADYRRLLANAELAEAEERRAWSKADLHVRWREMHREHHGGPRPLVPARKK